MSALAVSWDEWRASYDRWGFIEQQDFYDQVFEIARVQRQHDARSLRRLLEYVAEPVWVVELGGWDGELAAVMLAGGQVQSWENWEISRAAREQSVCVDPRYTATGGQGFYWEHDHSCDVFVASHVLEHLRWRDVQAVFDRTQAEWLYLQVPVGERPREWGGYHGSHILEVGWQQLEDDLWDRGYAKLPGLSSAGIRCYERRPA